tara:strand:+ start:3395 stop:5476 length:2082 start_codon:yes stop_codon:yes gene_type:complete
MKDLAILLPYKENFTEKSAGAASIWVKDYLDNSKLKKRSIVYGNLENNSKPLVKNFKNLKIGSSFVKRNISYTDKLYKEYLKHNFKIIEIHNRPESLLYLIKKKVQSKLIFVYHNNPQDLRSSSTVKERIFIAENTHQIYFVSQWVKNKFFEDLPYKHRNNCDILYPAINPIKKLPKKQKLIIFTGKLNSSKGFDIYGKSVIKILNKFKDWKALAIGNEPREKFNFKHDRFKILDWVTHREILNYYKKSSISVVPSRWQEPFGRTAMESAAFGCATITSKKGGLPETFDNSLFINKINQQELFSIIQKLIKNKILRFKIQKKNCSNVLHKISDHVKKIDSLKNFFLSSDFNYNKGSKFKILHISTFDERSDHRLFNISIANKLSKGFIRNDHDVINFSYRNYLSKNFLTKSNNIINEKVINITDNYRPDIIVLGHNNILESNTLSSIKSKYKSKVILWYEDALGHKGEGPNWRNNLSLIENNKDLIDQYYLTTHPDEINTKIDKKKLNYLPIPVDPNIENLKIYEYKNRYKDLFFALSHGVNFGRLKKGKNDERENFINELMRFFPDIKYNILGISNELPKWNYNFYNELIKCKMSLNLSRGKPLKYTSSNRIAALVGNGIYTFIDEKTRFNDFFNSNEIGFYKNLKDLGNKIEYMLKYPNKVNAFAKNGKYKYFKLFNNKRIAKTIINKIFN